MIHLLDPVPFTIENEAHLGLSEAQGLLSSDGRGIVIEFRLADTLFGLVKSSTKEIRIPFTDVQSVRYEKKYLGMVASITIRARNMLALQAIPHAKVGSIQMRISRKDRQNAEELCLALQEAVLRVRNALINDEITGMLGTEELE
jgi:hypothetical protein